VHVQSTWFPLIDRNPQSWVDNVFQAEEADFVAARHRVHHAPGEASWIELATLPR
jgi:predicted acyl esterase